MSSKRELKRLKRLERIQAKKVDREQPVEVTTVVHPAAVVLDPPVTLTVAPENLPVAAPGPVEPVELEPATQTAEPRICKVYGRPPNQRLRWVEFRDGSHGRMWVSAKMPPMVGWTVWAVPAKGGIPGDWDLHGAYNARGVRIR